MRPGPTLETIGLNPNINLDEPGKSEEIKDGNIDDPSKIIDVDLNCMDDIDDEELDSYIVSEDEFKKKKRAWKVLYAAYLEEQKRMFQFYCSKKVMNKKIVLYAAMYRSERFTYRLFTLIRVVLKAQAIISFINSGRNFDLKKK